MAKPDKATAVAEISAALSSATASVLTEYRGLTVSQLTELRRALGADTRYAVVKNTLTKIAAQQAGLGDLDALLEGPTAIAFVNGDPVLAAKGVRDFARTHPLLLIKGGVLDGRTVSADEIRRLADLESREVLLAKLAGAMQGSLSQAVRLFAEPLAQTARLAEALRQQREEQGVESTPAVDEAVAADQPAVPEQPATVDEAAAPDQPAAPEQPAAADEPAAPDQPSATGAPDPGTP